jgi:hypothetical protein
MVRFIKVGAAAAVVALLAVSSLSAGPRSGGGAGDMRGNGMHGGGMYSNAQVQPLKEPLTLDTAAQRASTALKDWGYTDLVVDEVVQYMSGFYVHAKEKSTGKGAMELFVDAQTGVVSPAPGPARMWNTKYGRHVWTGTGAGATVTSAAAEKAARDWLAARGDATAWTLKVKEMYGYFTVNLVKDGRVEGMLGVNAINSQVAYYNWLGTFIASKSF